MMKYFEEDLDEKPAECQFGAPFAQGRRIFHPQEAESQQKYHFSLMDRCLSEVLAGEDRRLAEGEDVLLAAADRVQQRPAPVDGMVNLHRSTSSFSQCQSGRGTLVRLQQLRVAESYEIMGMLALFHVALANLSHDPTKARSCCRLASNSD